MKLEEFNPSLLKLGSTMCFIGKRHTGKTVLITDILYRLYKEGAKNGKLVDACVCFSNTEDLQSNFTRFVPKAFIYSNYSEQRLVNILETQKELVKKQGRTSNLVIILDDFGYKKSIFNETFGRLLCNGRHYNITLMLSLQYSMQLPPSMRSNIDICVSLREPILANRKRLFDSFYGMFHSFKEFEKCFAEVTNNYGCLIAVNNGSSSNDVTDNMFWYRAKPQELPERFELGRSIYWRWSKQYKLTQNIREGTNKNNSIVQVERRNTSNNENPKQSNQGSFVHPPMSLIV